MEYKYVKLTDDTVARLIALSEMWVEEDLSYGIVKNTKKDLHEPVLAAFDGENMVGYIFGHPYTAEKKRGYIEAGASCFSIDELFVIKEYRSKGIGKALFDRYYDEVCQKYDYLTLATSTKDFKKVLNFYINKVGMDFHSAFLIKKIQKP